MRIVIDYQPAQTLSSGYRGVGRYTKEIVKEFLNIVSNEDEVFIALNGYYKESCRAIKDDLYGLLPSENIKVWNWYPEITAGFKTDITAYKPANFFREWFLHQFNADVIWSFNFQEGLNENGVSVSLGDTKSNEYLLGTLYDLSPIILGQDKLHDKFTKKWYLKALEYITKCDGVVTDSDFSKLQITRILNYQENNICVAKPAVNTKIFSISEDLNYDKKENYILYVGGASDYKNPKSLIKAFQKMPQSIQNKYTLILAGKEILDQKDVLLSDIDSKFLLKRIKLLGYLTDYEIVELLRKSKVFVYPSLAEGFGLPPVEAISCGALALVSNTTSLPETVGLMEATFDPYDVNSISEKLQKVLTDDNFANYLLKNERDYVKTLSWKNSAKKIYDFLKTKVSLRKTKLQSYTYHSLINDLSKCNEIYYDTNYLEQISKSISDSELFKTSRNIYIDCSVAIGMKTPTGIQRVTNALIENIKAISCQKFNVHAVYTNQNMNCFVKAEWKNLRFNTIENLSPEDIVNFSDGDVLLMPDLHLPNIVEKQSFLEELTYRHGVRVFTVLYDLIPVHMANAFNSEFVEEFLIYLKAISRFSGIITDSKAVLDDYKEWKIKNNIISPKGFIETWFHLGCDFKNAITTKKFESEDFSILDSFKSNPTFLVVSTIEPRKMHKQILNAFDILWNKNIQANLVFVGRYGWKMDEFKKEMGNHPLLNKRFFWLQGISDEFLDETYKTCTCVIFASQMEGFGLSIIEGAQHGKPLILRDIPVFREVAEDKAFYFKGEQPIDLANKIEEWLELYKNNKIPQSKGIECLTWEESSRMLIERLNIFNSDENCK